MTFTSSQNWKVYPDWPSWGEADAPALHSTVLRGKTIAELNQNGVKTKGYVYSGSARIATQDVLGGGTVFFECTNPVTGAAITTDANGAYTTRQEPDPLGRDLTEPIAARSPIRLRVRSGLIQCRLNIRRNGQAKWKAACRSTWTRWI